MVSPNPPQLLVNSVKQLFGLFDQLTHAFLARRAGSRYCLDDLLGENVIRILRLQFVDEFFESLVDLEGVLCFLEKSLDVVDARRLRSTEHLAHVVRDRMIRVFFLESSRRVAKLRPEGALATGCFQESTCPFEPLGLLNDRRVNEVFLRE